MPNAEQLAKLKDIFGLTLSSDGLVAAKKDVFFKDPFVDGWIFGTVSEYAKLLGLSEEQQRELMAAIDNEVAPKRGLFSFGGSSPHPREGYRKDNNPDWKKGTENAARYVQWVMDPDSMQKDPQVRPIIARLWQEHDLEAAPDALKNYYKANGGVFAGQGVGMLRIALTKKQPPEDPVARAFCEDVDNEALQNDLVAELEGLFWGNYSAKMKRRLSDRDEGVRQRSQEVVGRALAAYTAGGQAIEPKPVTIVHVFKVLWEQQFFDIANTRFGRKLIS